VWALLDASDITVDANWAGVPRTNELGQLPLSGVSLRSEDGFVLRGISTITTARIANRVAHVICEGTITAGTYVRATVTGPPANGGVAKVVDVPIVVGDTPQKWQDKVVAALNADTDFNPHYKFYATGGLIQMQEVVKTASDVFSCNISVGDTTGVVAKSSNQTLQNMYHACGRVTIPSEYVTAGQKFLIVGGIEFLTGSVNTTAGANYIALISRMGGSGSAMSPVMFGANAALTTEATGGVASTIQLTSSAVFADAAGKLSLKMSNAATGVGVYGLLETARTKASGVIAEFQKSFSDSTTVKLDPSIDCEIELVAIGLISPTGIGGQVSFNLRVIPVSSWA
jgi:hypothetical protein